MSSYELQIRAKTNNSGIRTAVKAQLPSEGDPRFATAQLDLYSFRDGVDDADGIKVIEARYLYTLESDATALLNSLKGLAGVINSCEDGSYITPFKNNHLENPSIISERLAGAVKQ
jgi:hypothetical protein